MSVKNSASSRATVILTLRICGLISGDPKVHRSLETGAGGVTPQIYSPEEFRRIRDHQANGIGGLPSVGDPASVARDMAQLAALGLRGIAISFVDYLDELPYFCAEVLPRLARSGVRGRDAAPRPASP